MKLKFVPAGSPFRENLTAYNGRLNILCFSHLRWDFVYQRPQHLMAGFAQDHHVLFWEEPIYRDGLNKPTLQSRTCPHTGVTILTPHIDTQDRDKVTAILITLLDEVLTDLRGTLVRWYYTPMMLPFSDHLSADCTVYDCMDELSAFRHAPPELLNLEEKLLAAADIVFTGGSSLYEAKRDRHSNVHAFPSSIDVAHFAQARGLLRQPDDQAGISSPRLGFCGVIDERMDLGLLAATADAHPDWSLVMIGPVVKIDEADLPQRANIHYLGSKPYAELPSYMVGWDVALMPFAINEATRFISPTKTPEYLAAGCTVVSTAIADVVRHYGNLAAVEIASTPQAFVVACEVALQRRHNSDTAWRDEADAILAQTSWTKTVRKMSALIASEVVTHSKVQTVVSPTSWPPKTDRYDVLVVGAGFAGAVMAERLARDGGKRVLVVDRRPHIAGNAFDRLDEAGILMHQYGPHIFHTNSRDVFDYLSGFTEWREYEHRVLADVDGKLVPMPINRTTLNALYDLDLKTDEDVEAFLADRAEPIDPIRTSADVVMSKVGRELYETFFQGYTRKQWGMDPSELDKSVTARVPTRTNVDDRYFTDTFQAMPLNGYTQMFERMLDHPNIDVLLGVEYSQVRESYPHDHLVFTGPIDEYFGYRYGKLPYRSLRFRHETLSQSSLQPVGVVNYPHESVPYTRITEYKHLTGQASDKTSITYEYPCDDGDPYYPIPRDENQVLYKRYEALAIKEAGVSFVGRLATYRYYNMDQVVGQALATYRRLALTWENSSEPVAATSANASKNAA
ncbi:UDP-galactopyranose mutase [Sphingomonas faeni]|uniref:UDP-galactopyranose mutase n=1 Tax=Sphingomonas faeni TaxID=185950 RepID=UPI00278A8967|nr:UDP-galactopyranose mutase [Sphingomonas faeni]MDQ0840263.1 UDP-galactopyranose mutase [Sphingomonas faeni]